MVLWALLITVTLISCAILFYAGKTVSVNVDAETEIQAYAIHQRGLLREIEADFAAGRISGLDAETAKGELAREILRQKKHDAIQKTPFGGQARGTILATLVGITIASVGTYALLGEPEMSAMPLAIRQPAQLENVNLDVAIAQVEARLAEFPDDVRGWQVLAPIYMRASRFEDAATAFRHILALSPVTADAEVDLAEALMMLKDGDTAGEPLVLLQSAAARDPGHVRSRFYLAGAAIQNEQYDQAVGMWRDVLRMSEGDEPWLAAARRGLEVAHAGSQGVDVSSPTFNPEQQDAQNQQELIEGMVARLAERLASEGGTIEEWTQMVQSRLVLNQPDAAQDAYTAAKQAYPNANDRVELDALAVQNGLR